MKQSRSQASRLKRKDTQAGPIGERAARARDRTLKEISFTDTLDLITLTHLTPTQRPTPANRSEKKVPSERLASLSSETRGNYES